MKTPSTSPDEDAQAPNTAKERRLARARAWKANNRERVRQVRKAYYRANRDRELANHRNWAEQNQDRLKAIKQRCGVAYRDANRERLRAAATTPTRREKRNARERARYASDPQYAIEKRLRASLTQALRRAGVRKTTKSFDLVGCSLQDLKRHLESRFLPGMSWDNGDVHIDHIRPVSSFDLTDPEQQHQCFHFTNLQPLWKRDNLRKGNRWPATLPQESTV